MKVRFVIHARILSLLVEWVLHLKFALRFSLYDFGYNMV